MHARPSYVYAPWALLTPKGPMSVDGFLGSLGRLSRRQKHERSTEILKEGGPM
jgi:hypothetical protein